MTQLNPHEGHRLRMRQRFIENGREGLNDHELLEILLYYAVPRKNTNELAHKLLTVFGSLNAVLDADISDLKEAGLSENAAVYLKLVREVGKGYISKETDKPRFITIGDAADYITAKLYGEKQEQLHIYLLDMRMRLVAHKKLAEGGIDSVVLDSRTLLKAVLSANAAYAILAHNHQSGAPRPTRSDIELTRSVVSLLNSVNVKLCDHIIVAGKDFYSFNQGMGIDDGGDAGKLKAHQYADITR